MSSRTSKFTTGKQGSLYNKNLGRFKVELTGDWGDKIRQLEKLPRRVSQLVLRHQVLFAERLQEKVLDTILNGGYGKWEPLSPKYMQFKMSHPAGGTGGFYQFGGGYMKSVGYIIRANKPYSTVIVGIIGNSKSPVSSLTTKQYALILEHGSLRRGIPARPVWAPSFKAIGGLASIAGPLQQSLNKIKIT